MTEDLQLMRDDIVESAYEELVAQVNAMIKAVVLQERELCASVCEKIRITLLANPDDVERGFNAALRTAAAAIRNQGKTNE